MPTNLFKYSNILALKSEMYGRIAKTRMAKPLTARWTNAMANFENRFIIVSGGFHPETRLEHFSVEMYSIKKNEWSNAPGMNE